MVHGNLRSSAESLYWGHTFRSHPSHLKLMTSCEVKINGKPYTPDELFALGKELGQLAGKMTITDGELTMAIALVPFVEGFSVGHRESSAATVVHMELEQFKRFKFAREEEP